MAKKIFMVNPPIDVEIINHTALGDVVARVDVGDDGSWDVTFDFFGGQGAWEDHLVRIFQEAGRTDIATRQQAAAFLLAKPKAEVDVTIKEAWNAMLKLLCDFINMKWTAAGQPQTSNVYQTAEEVISAQLAATQASLVDGKLVLKIP